MVACERSVRLQPSDVQRDSIYSLLRDGASTYCVFSMFKIVENAKPYIYSPVPTHE